MEVVSNLHNLIGALGHHMLTGQRRVTETENDILWSVIYLSVLVDN